MPRDANGVYSLPSAYLAVTGETITAVQHNTPLEDIANAITQSIARDGRTGITADIPWSGKRITNLGAPVDDTDAATRGFVRAQMPVGTVCQFVATAAPAGFLKLNGAALSRTTYADLWAYAQASGALVSQAAYDAGQWGAFGQGDGTTTFRLPDLRGIFPRAWDDGRGVDPGRAIGAYQANQNQSHTHGVNDPTHAHGVYDPGHAHSVSDPGHSHGVNDPGHQHYYESGNDDFNYGGGPDRKSTTPNGKLTGVSGTGIWLSASGVGIGIYAAGTGIGIYNAGTGIYLSAQGGSEARPQNQSLLYCIKY